MTEITNRQIVVYFTDNSNKQRTTLIYDNLQGFLTDLPLLKNWVLKNNGYPNIDNKVPQPMIDRLKKSGTYPLKTITVKILTKKRLEVNRRIIIRFVPFKVSSSNIGRSTITVRDNLPPSVALKVQDWALHKNVKLGKALKTVTVTVLV